MLHHSVAR